MEYSLNTGTCALHICAQSEGLKILVGNPKFDHPSHHTYTYMRSLGLTATTMKLTCAARHLCAPSDVPIPIKLPGDKSDTSPSAPDEPKHICEYCHKPMHGGICGQNFKDVHGTLDKTKIHLLQLMLLLLKQMTTL